MSKAWPMVALGEVVTPVMRPEYPVLGKEYRQIGVRLWGQGAYERETIDGGATQYKSLSRVEAGDIIVNKIWARNGSVSVVSEGLAGCYASNEFPTFVPKAHLLLPEWASWLTKTQQFWEQCDELSRGTSGQNRIRPEKFLQVQIPLPPLDEQRRIVARIEELAARIAEARGLRREVEILSSNLSRQSVDHILLGSNPRSAEIDVESVSISITDGDHQPPPKSETGIPFIFISNVASGSLDLSESKYVPIDYYQNITLSRLPQKGDVLYTTVGSYGIPCVVDTDEPFCFQRHIAIIKPNKTLILSRYLYWALYSNYVYIQASSYVTGSAQQTLPLRGIRKLHFPLPSLNRQQQIVEEMDIIRLKISSAIDYQKEVTTELNALLPSILDKAFRGEL